MSNLPSNPNKPTKKRGLFWLIIFAVVALVAYFCYFKPFFAASPTEDEPPKLQSVVYDVAHWQTLPLSDAKTAKQTLGVAASVSDALDFEGRKASRFAFSGVGEPVLAWSESERFIELIWYYPSAADSDADKARALDFAQRIYQAMGALAGKDGTAVVEKILDNQSLSQSSLGKYTLKQAHCKHTQCRIILAK